LVPIHALCDEDCAFGSGEKSSTYGACVFLPKLDLFVVQEAPILARFNLEVEYQFTSCNFVGIFASMSILGVNHTILVIHFDNMSTHKP
jgi:hypothetical protein